MDDARKRRTTLTVADIERVTGDPTPKPPQATLPTPQSEPASDVPEAQRTQRKPKVAKKAGGINKTVSFRLNADAREELERVARLHSQPAGFVIKKLIDQWLAKSQEKREEILTK
ncbi:hypothetical protein [Paracoccus sp. T5]|uniref:hypothetical protein n=1 Tax=Paracoccus sp. T5 TaxID=3402161 RepID=UPI003AE17602